MNLYRKAPIGDNLMKKRISQLVMSANYDENVLNTILATYDYMRCANQTGLSGGCHALSSVLYVVFCELGLNPELFVGECQKPGDKPFDHSWVTIDGKILDIAIYMPLQGMVGSTTGPVIFNIDALTMKTVETVYGINTGLPMSNQTIFAIETPFSEYMSMFPYEIGGLWSLVKKVAPTGLNLDVQNLYRKYSTTKRNFLR